MPYEVIKLIDLLFQGLYLALFIRIILSWIPHNAYHPAISFIYRLTNPMLSPFQNLIPSHKIGLDLSPIFAFIALSVIRKFIFKLL